MRSRSRRSPDDRNVRPDATIAACARSSPGGCSARAGCWPRSPSACWPHWAVGWPVGGARGDRVCRRRSRPRRWRRAARSAQVEPIARTKRPARGSRALSARDLAAAVPDPLIIFDGDGATLHANDAAVAAFGPFAPGLPLQLKFRAPEMQELIEDAAVRRGRKQRRRLCRARADRARLPRHRHAASGGDGALFVLVFKDQSETRRIDRMRADFIANASHELRTPLASIAGFIETLRGPARNDAEGARAVPEDHAGPDRPHGAADRRPAVAVAAGDEAVPAGRHRGRSARDGRERHRFAWAAGARDRRRDRCANFRQDRSTSPATATNCSRCSRTCSRTPANTASRAATRGRLDRAARGIGRGRRRASPSAISARASPRSTFRASPSASTGSTSRPAAARRAPASAWPSSSTS